MDEDFSMTEEEIEEIEEDINPMDDTEIIIEDTLIQTVQTPIYEFQLRDKTHPDYTCCVSIIEWIKSNLEELTDTHNDQVFSKVNYGYNQDTLKGFGKKPVCDVYIDHMEYSSDFDNNKPNTVHSFIICYLKGNMNNSYLKACELTDFLIQQFEENEDFRELDNIVRGTSVSNVELEIIPSGKTYGVLSAFELEHELY